VNKNVKIALVVIQPDSDALDVDSDPLNNKEKQAAQKLKYLAETVGISDQHIAQISLTGKSSEKSVEKACSAVKDGLLRMVGLVVEEKIKNLKQKINNTTKNSLSLLKMHVRYQLKLGVFYEIKCELDNSNSNERNCFKAYRTSYVLLDEVYKEIRAQKQVKSGFLDLGILEILALARLISGRLIQFSLVQDLSITEAVSELMKHFKWMKSVIFADSEQKTVQNSQKTSNLTNSNQFLALTTFYNQFISLEKSEYAGLIYANWDSSKTGINKQPPSNTPGDYYLQSAKHLLMVLQNLNFFVKNMPCTSPTKLELLPDKSKMFLSLDQKLSLITENQYLEREAKNVLPSLKQQIQDILKKSRVCYEKFEPKSRKLLSILIELAEINPVEVEQFQQLSNLKFVYISENSRLPNLQVFNKISRLMLRNKESPLEEKLASSFELSDSKSFTRFLVSGNETSGKEPEMKPEMEKYEKRVVLQPGFVQAGSFVAGFVQEKSDKMMKIQFSFVSRMAKLLQNYTSQIVVVITGEHGTGDIELVSDKSTELDFECEQNLNYDESFSVSSVRLVVRNGSGLVTFVLPSELITSKISTLYNVCEIARPDPTKSEKVLVEKVEPKVKYVHEQLFFVELEGKDVRKLENVSFGNENYQPAEKVYFTKNQENQNSDIIFKFKSSNTQKFKLTEFSAPEISQNLFQKSSPLNSKTSPLPLSINIISSENSLQVGKWNEIQITVKNVSSISRHFSINLNTSYDQEMVWKRATSKQKHRVQKNKSVVQFFECMPLAPINSLYLNEYFSVRDFTRSAGFNYDLNDDGVGVAGISAI